MYKNTQGATPAGGQGSAAGGQQNQTGQTGQPEGGNTEGKTRDADFEEKK